MTTICFVPGWTDETISQYHQRLALLTPNSAGKWKNIELVDDPTEADFVICQDRQISVDLALARGVNSSQIIFIKREPAYCANTIAKHQGLAYLYQDEGLFCPAVHWLNRTFEQLLYMEIPEKTRILSTVVSSESILEGHRARLNWINRLSSLATIDVYGRGHHPGSFNNQYKGPLNDPGRCKSKALFSYSYSVAIENGNQSGYFSEKLTDVLLSYAVPIYHGAPDINLYYPAKALYRVDSLTDSTATQLAYYIKHHPFHSPETIEAIEYSRELILFKYNIWNVVWSLVKRLS